MDTLMLWGKRLLLCVVCFSYCISSAPVFAGPPNIDGTNPFTDKSDIGGADYIAVIGTEGNAEDGLINVIKGVINWILGILALIALILLLYAGFLMLTAAGNEDRYNKGRTIMKQAFIGLLVIGFAWFIVSMIFYLVNLTGVAAGPTGG